MSLKCLRRGASLFLIRFCQPLVFLLAAPFLIHAQCPEELVGPSFAEGEIYYVDIDVRYHGTTIESQIRQAASEWTYENTHHNTSNVRFQVIESWNDVPAGANVLHVSERAFTDPNSGGANPYTYASIVPVRRVGTTLREATIFFNTNSRADPLHSDPYFNPNAAGYDSIYNKVTKHEIGTGWGWIIRRIKLRAAAL
ncbi:MAG TPA: hypothetical protein VNA19_00730 [Pyrinomonadaceae bacterium]|jgi:hypothetical protein|nr:hypothetical protein [Pyrinomonadaceae bacterium]